jgi:hypothetical protein
MKNYQLVIFIQHDPGEFLGASWEFFQGEPREPRGPDLGPN